MTNGIKPNHVIAFHCLSQLCIVTAILSQNNGIKHQTFQNVISFQKDIFLFFLKWEIFIWKTFLSMFTAIHKATEKMVSKNEVSQQKTSNGKSFRLQPKFLTELEPPPLGKFMLCPEKMLSCCKEPLLES